MNAVLVLALLSFGFAGYKYLRDLRTTMAGEDHVWVSTPRGRKGNRPILWQERTLITQLGLDAVTMRYRGTYIGWPWLIIRPVISSVGITFVFSGVARVKAGGGIPYFLFALGGQATWNMLRMGVMMTTRSLARTSHHSRSVHIPSTVAVAGFVSPALAELAVGLAVAAVAAVAYRFVDGTWYLNGGVRLLLLPVAIVLLIAVIIAVGQWTAVLSRTYRDLRYMLGSLISLWSFVTPVMYPATAIPANLRWALSINPAALPVLMGREAFFGNSGLTPAIVTRGLISITVLLVFGSLARFVDGRFGKGGGLELDLLDEFEEEEDDLM